MNYEAISRVPMSDWMLAVAVLVCGAVAIAATWRWAGRLTFVVSPETYGGPGEGREPEVVLPQGPNGDDIPELDDVDRVLWEMIESEYRRNVRRNAPVPVPALLRRRPSLARSIPVTEEPS